MPAAVMEDIAVATDPHAAADLIEELRAEIDLLKTTVAIKDRVIDRKDGVILEQASEIEQRRSAMDRAGMRFEPEPRVRLDRIMGRLGGLVPAGEDGE